ncbi:MarR family winged helix-turn-helix transcriptional regulator [Phaeobacter sp. HF9A]|uniref:MarR family winged helix-turn-helix transcriptional regulator n=1 Tax=Phaeobacter sp. HF9A TaxID=2721561 RepID=UPI00142F8A9A|nr:MarR family winged helix-turn-helix transcriptional regulator [Phaeobacter sp. HF9A]NIZ12324.1 winged helix-turn-helix transcriptional regulator [Phaeobacter sp. HF9A]
MTNKDIFDLEGFLPFLINQAAEATSKAFQPVYRDGYGLSRTQWRVLAITGRYQAISSRDICLIAHEEKSRVSRAVSALVAEGLIEKSGGEVDKRIELLTLSAKGRDLYQEIGQSAQAFDAKLQSLLGPDRDAQLRDLLTDLHVALDQLTPK